MNTLKSIFTKDSELAIGGIVTFVIAFGVFLRTVAPTVSLWDCGEFIASSYILGVPHPPGAPFFLILGRLFSLIPFHDDIGFRVNLISVISSALTILLLYLIIIQLIRSFRGIPKDLFDKFIMYGSASIGALTYAFSETFWFNAVEAEVYALSMLFTSASLWLALKWFENREELSSIRNLLLIIYFMGLAYGVHLLNFLVVPTIMLLILFNQPKFLFNWRLWLLAMTVATGVTLLPLLFLGGTLNHFLNLILLNVTIALVLGLSLSVYHTIKNPKLETFFLTAAFTAGTALVLLAGANRAFSVLNANLGTWELPILIGISSPLFMYLLFFAISFAVGFVILEYKPELLSRWQSLLIAMLLAVAGTWVIISVGKSTYALIIMRSGMDPIINENNPSTLSNLLYYLNREQYGSTSLLSTLFDRAASLWDYQIKFMFLRYFGWNFIGKGLTYDARGYIQESFSLIGLMGLPFLIGIIGFIYHSFKDWTKSFSVFVFFLFSGLVLVLYLNQPDPQPRERDYVYVGSFFAFALWIGLGVFAILNGVKSWLEKGLPQKFGVVFTAGILVLICPLNQIMHNFDSNDRKGNYVPWDLSYNMLMSCEENAILFTNGDNDTFPLWYLQEVEGIRKDVKIVNLSLLNTNWYIHQLKHYEPKLNILISDDQIEKIRPMAWESRQANLQVTREVYEAFYREYEQPVPASLENTTSIPVQINSTFSVSGQTAIKVQDIMIYHIIEANKWKRPVYFGITVNNAFFLGFKEYLRMDGIVWKVTPVKSPPINPDILRKNLLEKYRYRGLDDPDVYLEFGTVRLLGNYRQGYIKLAENYINTGQKSKAVEVLDKMSENIPEFRYSDSGIFEIIGRLYYAAGRPRELHSRLLKMLSLKPEIPRKRQLTYAGMLFSVFRDTVNAEEVYLEIWSTDRNDNNAFSALISLYEAAKQFQKAVTSLEQWLEYHPEDSIAQMKLHQIQELLASNPEK